LAKAFLIIFRGAAGGRAGLSYRSHRAVMRATMRFPRSSNLNSSSSELFCTVWRTEARLLLSLETIISGEMAGGLQELAILLQQVIEGDLRIGKRRCLVKLNFAVNADQNSGRERADAILLLDRSGIHARGESILRSGEMRPRDLVFSSASMPSSKRAQTCVR